MSVSRRDFFKITGAAAGGQLLTALGLSNSAVAARAYALKISDAKEVSSVCCFCSCGCGLIVYVKDNEIVNLEGDPDHPVNNGRLCTRAYAMREMPNRILSVLYLMLLRIT